MTATDLIVEKADIQNTRLISTKTAERSLNDGQVLARVDRFALTSNNLSYAAAGDMLGYWNFFPTDDPAWGIVPVWGFATVVRSAHSSISEGERLFGFLPMARHVVLEPSAVTEVTFSDQFEHRSQLHPWYTRYYRAAADPVTSLGHTDIQPALWALFMTGWMLADELETNRYFGAEQVIIASASSKTAYALAHSLAAGGAPPRIIGLTSSANRDFVTSLGSYHRVMTYDRADEISSLEGRAVFVDMSGNAAVVRGVHQGIGDRLTESIRVGATHLGARGDLGDLPGPSPRFFFIPDVAEARAAAVGFDAHHAEFAAAWASFAPWAESFTQVTTATGPEAIESAYRSALAGMHDPTTATMLTF